MCTSSGIEVIDQGSAFKWRVRTYKYVNIDFKDLHLFLTEAQRIFINQAKQHLNAHKSLKINFLLEAKFHRWISGLKSDADENDENEETEQISTFFLQSPMKWILLATDLGEWFKSNVIDVLVAKADGLQGEGSGWALHEIISLDVCYNKFSRFKGSSYMELPPSIKKKRAIVNVKNSDNQCFRWAILSKLHPADDNSDRLSKYERFKDELNFDGIEFPMRISDIDLFEELNPTISVNVYILQREYCVFRERMTTVVVPIRLTEETKADHVHLLLLFQEIDENDSEECGDFEDACSKDTMEEIEASTNKHYVWIKNLGSLILRQTGKKNSKRHVCDRCLHYFHSEEKLDNHIKLCRQQNETRVSLPDKWNNLVKFRNFKHKIEIPFIIYADIESLLMSTTNECARDGKKVPKGATQRHIPNSIGYYFHSRMDPSLSYYRCFTGVECIDEFILDLKQQMENVVWEKLHKNIPMKLTEKEEADFQKAIRCHICDGVFSMDKNFDWCDRVRDHCHLSGEYRGAAHPKCNFKFQVSKSVPVVFHNLDYDSHFLIEKLANLIEGRLTIIPKNSEHYISFTKTLPHLTYEYADDDENCNGGEKPKRKYRENLRLTFIDSYRFLNSALAKLAETLSFDKLHITQKQWSNLSEECIHLLTKKGVYPYSYMDSWEKLEEQQLPSREQFYDDLNDSEISDKDYAFAQKVWRTFNIHSMQEYTDLYLKTDVLLLADIFENFRNNSIRLYGLDPAHYYTLPGYSWDCLLKYTGVRIELLTSIDQLMFVERGLRGGISQCSKRWCKANNKYMNDEYDPNIPSTYLLYLDVNNLYGWAMSQSLPISNFEWVEDSLSDTEQIKRQIMNTSDNSDFGFLLEVDLEYPKELHDLHNDYPFCAEHMSIGDSKQSKLVLTLYDKKSYVVHYRMLKFALMHGLKLKKVHRILKFKQSTWMKKYITLNSHERANAKNEFEKDLFKLMNNAVFGKTMENIRNRVDIKLITKWDGRFGLESMIAKPNFKRNVIFHENLVACELKRLNVYMTKPMIVGMCILDISKIQMCEFHYNFMLRKLSPEKCRILYTDTDSFVYEIHCDDAYALFRENKARFDTSDFPLDNPYDIKHFNKKVLGVMKDEYKGELLKEFIGLRSKMYTVKTFKNKITKKGKGVKKYVLDRKISFDDYMKCIVEKCELKKDQTRIQSSRHNVYTIKNEKKVLDPNDDKRFLMPDSFDTLAWGHYKIQNNC